MCRRKWRVFRAIADMAADLPNVGIVPLSDPQSGPGFAIAANGRFNVSRLRSRGRKSVSAMGRNFQSVAT